MTSSRKRRNLEIERQKRRQRSMFVAGFLGVCAIVVVLIGFVIWDVQSRSWIMEFNGERIETSDLRFLTSAFLSVGLDPDEAREVAMGELTSTLALLERAERHNLGASQEEIAGLIPEAQAQIEWLGANFISARRAAELFSATSYAHERLMDFYVPDYTPDETEFAEALEEYSAHNAWTMNFGGEEFTGELRFLAQSYEMLLDPEMAREAAIDELARNLAVLQRGEMHGVGLTEYELDEMIEQAEMQRQWMGDVEISSERMAEIWLVANVQGRLMDIYAPEVEFDPAEIQEFLLEYVENNRDNYTVRNLQYVVLETPEEAMAVLAQTPTDDFEALIWEYCVMQDQDFGADIMDMNMLITNFGVSEEDAEIIRAMQEGDTHLVQVDTFFVVLYLQEYSEATDEEIGASFTANFEANQRMFMFDDILSGWIEEANVSVTADEASFREQFIMLRRFDLFLEILDGWIDEANIEINQRAYDAV